MTVSMVGKELWGCCTQNIHCKFTSTQRDRTISNTEPATGPKFSLEKQTSYPREGAFVTMPLSFTTTYTRFRSKFRSIIWPGALIKHFNSEHASLIKEQHFSPVLSTHSVNGPGQVFPTFLISTSFLLTSPFISRISSSLLKRFKS